MSLKSAIGLAVMSVTHDVDLSVLHPMESKQSPGQDASRRCLKQLQRYAGIAVRRATRWYEQIRREEPERSNI